MGASTCRKRRFEKVTHVQWSAKVRSISLPDFPFEETSFMPIACATVQRVDMLKLREIIKKASKASLELYHEAKMLQSRSRIVGLKE